MTKRYKVAVVGLGVGISHITEAYATMEDRFDLALFCDLDQARLDEACARFGGAATTSYEDVLARPDIDIVDICTPSFLHFPQALAALRAGKHVICEKPVAGSLAEIDALRRAEAASAGRIMPIFQYRWGAGSRAARAIMEAGLAGRPIAATAETHWLRGADYYSNGWRGTWAGEMGGTMTTHATHIHDMLCWFFGPVASVCGQAATVMNRIETEDCATAMLRFENGAMATLSAMMNSPDQYSRLWMGFEHVTFETTREPYNIGRGPWTVRARDAARQAEIDALLAGLPPEAERFAGQIAAFHDSLVTGAPLPVTLADAETSVALLSAFYRSAQTGAPVTLPIAVDDPLRDGWQPEQNKDQRSAREWPPASS